MSFSINNQQFSSFAPLSSGKEARRPIVIEGEKLNNPKATDTTAAQQASHSYTYERIVEARPTKENEQLFGAKSVLSPRSPLTAFANAAQPALNLGRSVDTYA